MNISGVGIWSAGLRFRDDAETLEAAAELEDLGYTSIWMPDYNGGIFAAAERMLAATGTMVVASGILSVWVYSAEEAAAAYHRLRDAYGDRFLMGIGVSHAPVVETVLENVRYEKPLRVMAAFLDGLDSAATPVSEEARVLAALGPKMLELAGRRAGGAHPYNVTPEHTALARKTLGPTKQLIPEQAVALTTNADEGRQLGREFLHHYLELPNYANNLRRLGFTDDDFADGGSDRLVDAVIAWGDLDKIASRIKEHLDAGADSVCVQVVSDGDRGGMVGLHRQVGRDLAPALTRL